VMMDAGPWEPAFAITLTVLTDKELSHTWKGAYSDLSDILYSAANEAKKLADQYPWP
jgi:hypothetical protein